tara:strand:- start:113 stop:346 length:234 start_codon:yes stop_codon:yes gene_type:complete
MSKIEENVIKKIRERAETGFDKYGKSMDRNDLDFFDWLEHLHEELMDGCVYIEKMLVLASKWRNSDGVESNDDGKTT